MCNLLNPWDDKSWTRHCSIGWQVVYSHSYISSPNTGCSLWQNSYFVSFPMLQDFTLLSAVMGMSPRKQARDLCFSGSAPFWFQNFHSDLADHFRHEILRDPPHPFIAHNLYELSLKQSNSAGVNFNLSLLQSSVIGLFPLCSDVLLLLCRKACIRSHKAGSQLNRKLHASQKGREVFPVIYSWKICLFSTTLAKRTFDCLIKTGK